jgi:hypothetical protein
VPRISLWLQPNPRFAIEVAPATGGVFDLKGPEGDLARLNGGLRIGQQCYSGQVVTRLAAAALRPCSG